MATNSIINYAKEQRIDCIYTSSILIKEVRIQAFRYSALWYIKETFGSMGRSNLMKDRRLYHKNNMTKLFK